MSAAFLSEAAMIPGVVIALAVTGYGLHLAGNAVIRALSRACDDGRG